MEKIEKNEKSVDQSSRAWYLRGLRDGIPIGLGYLAVGFTVGITARNIGMTPVQAGVMSLAMHASAGQFAAMTVMSSSAGYLEMVLTTLIVNLRYLLMSCSLSQKIDSRTRMGHRLVMSYYITDEIFGAASGVEGRLNPFYQYGMATVAGPGWTVGTFLGAALGAVLPQQMANAMNVALYGMFLAVIIPPARKERVIAVVVAVSMAASYLFSVLPVLRGISSGFRIMILTILIAGMATWLKPADPLGQDAEAGSENPEGGCAPRGERSKTDEPKEGHASRDERPKTDDIEEDRTPRSEQPKTEEPEVTLASRARSERRSRK